MRVSEYYHLGRTQPGLDFVDVDVYDDLAVFISPRAISRSDTYGSTGAWPEKRDSTGAPIPIPLSTTRQSRPGQKQFVSIFCSTEEVCPLYTHSFYVMNRSES